VSSLPTTSSWIVMLNLESVVTYEGTETIHELVVGKELTGVNAF